MYALDLSAEPEILFLFGLAGVGKDYVGRLISCLSGRRLYSADDDLTDEMRAAISDGRPFTEEMRTRYFNVVADRIAQLRVDGPLVVTQAVYRERHREFFRRTCPNTEFVWVTAEDDVVYARLAQRGNDVTPDYAARLKENFEPPPAGTKIVRNEGSDEALVQQLRQLFPPRR